MDQLTEQQKTNLKIFYKKTLDKYKQALFKLQNA